MKQKSLLLIALTLVLSLFLAACSSNNTSNNATNNGNNNGNTNNGGGTKEEEPADSNEPVQGGDLVIGSTGNPTLFNTLYSADTASSAIEGFVYDSLVGGNTEFEPELSMAASWEPSEDGLVHTVKLKEGLKFHDGEAVTAEDVKFTFEIPLSEDYDGPRASSFEKITSVEIVDDLTVKFTLSAVAPDFHITLSYGILPQHILGDVPVAEMGEHEFNRAPIGSGPFKFVEWVDGQYVKVEAFDDYHEGRPYLDTLTYKIVTDGDQLLTQLSTGDVQFTTVPSTDLETVKEWEGQGKLKIESGLALSYTYLGYNLRNPLFQDKSVRQALTHAIDRETIVSSVMNGDGEVAHFPESPLSWAYDDSETPKFEYDPEKAKEMLAAAGWKAGADGILEKDGQKFSFELKTNQGNKVREDIAVVVQQQLKEVGIEVKPNIMEWSAFLADVNPPAWKFDAIILGWSLGTDPDPSGIFHSKEIEEGLNFINYSNPKADELMDKNLSTMDQEERKGYIVEVNNIIAEEQPYTFLYYPNVHRAMPANLEGYTFHAKSDFYKINEWWLKPAN
ncbi:peptide/nickel transport system substrate-binding protein [Bacillus tianshenii]|uniref:Peptide/nickel transport system substrate-binding protein n=1 Tax=Sutcliffiella tianshenii TaxID=1463404 RepID=A0ABS2P108_9BACI|nr:peptide/nickel transport system substrate-binding protein [Bacillus tianshenii]